MIKTQQEEHTTSLTAAQHSQQQHHEEESTKGIKRRLSLSLTGSNSAFKPNTSNSAPGTEPHSHTRRNLFDPTLYELPSTPKGYYYKNSSAESLHKSGSPDLFDYSQAQGLVANTFSEKYEYFLKHYVPDMDSAVIISCCLWYVCSSVSSNLTKHILKEFPHPIALTELQFCISGLICVVFVTLVNYMSASKEFPILKMFPAGSLPEYLNGDFKQSIVEGFCKYDKVVFCSVFPMGIFQFVGHITSHKSTRLIPVSVVHSIKALSPIITVGYYKLVHKKDYKLMTYLTLIPLISGVIITCVSSSKKQHANNKSSTPGQQHVSSTFGSYFYGLNYAFISMLIFVAQNIFAKNILTFKSNSKDGLLGATNDVHQDNNHTHKSTRQQQTKRGQSHLNIDKITISFYCSCIGFLLDLPLFIYNEFTSRALYHDLSMRVLLYVIIHGVSHFVQTILAFQLIGSLSPVNYSIANIMKRICIILAAFFWENHWSLNQVLGIMLTMAGLYSYDKWGKAK